MREMRHIASMFNRSTDFDEQWILFKSYLNTIHSLSDNDIEARNNFQRNETMDFILVLRNVLHHQPAKWHFGKHDVYPASLNISLNSGQAKMTQTLKLVIQKDTLMEPDLQSRLGENSKKQLAILNKSLASLQSHVIGVYALISEAQAYVEKYCRQSAQYTEAFDIAPVGYKLVESR